MKKLWLLLIGLVFILTAQSQVIYVAVYESPPFVMENPDGTYSGLAIDVWENIAKDLDLQYDYANPDRSINELVSDVGQGEYDIALGSITINSDRMQNAYFTQPYTTVDISIASDKANSSFWVILANIFSLTFLNYIFLLFLVLFVVGCLIWLFERKKNEDFDTNPFKGLSEAFYFASVVMTTVGFGDKSAKTPIGRFIVVIWMFISLGITGVFIGNISSAITVNRLESGINSIHDLNKTKVGSMLNTTSYDFMESNDIRVIGYENVAEALHDITTGDLETFVYDTPILKYIIERDNLNLMLSDQSYETQYYGFAINPELSIKDDINRSLIRYIYSDQWEDNLAKYNLD